MDKSAGKQKRSPAGTTRRAYSIFGGIINLAHQQQQQQSHTQKFNALSPSSSSSCSAPGNAAAAGGVGGGTSQDPQGSSSNVYTVTVTNSEKPDSTNQVKTYDNLVPLKKQKGDQSTSTVSSLTPNSAGMNTSSSTSKGAGGGGGGANSAGAGARIGPAPRTLSILTALNELAISDKIEPNPTCSPLTPPASTGNNRSSNSSVDAPSSSGNIGINNVSGSPISKSNPSHSSCHYPPRRSSYAGNILQQQQQQQLHHHGNKTEHRAHEIVTSPSSSSSALNQHHHQRQYSAKNGAAAGSSGINTSSVYHSISTCSARGLYSASKSGVGARVAGNALLTKGYGEQLGAAAPPSSLHVYGNLSAGKHPFSPSPATNTLPPVLRRTGNKSRGSHKESSRKGVAKQRDRSKSRTPDWIWKIFQLTKHGKVEELQQSLLGLDPTLIRHLVDAKGNTVLHCAVRGGHVNTLQWLVSVLGTQCTEAALNDHNQARRTVLLTALKKGQLPCLQWLVHHTKCGEKALVPNEGERSLLHHAATLGNLNAVRWLCAELIDKGISVDIRDSGSCTPLHDAAKSGHITVCHELILAGADPLSQTELGWRPSDLAIRHRHMECASYCMAVEAAGSLGNQLHSLLLAFNHLRQEHEELRSHFRETLRVGKWLAKERNDLIKHFPSKWTQDAGNSCASGASGSASNTSSVSSPLSLLLGGATNGTRFSDLEHKLVLAEQAWKKVSQSSDDTSSERILNEVEASLSNVSSQEFLHRRLAAIQLRHERSQNLTNSVLSSGSSDEDPYQDSNCSSSDASSSDVEVEHITSVTAGAGAGGSAEKMMMMTMGQNSSAIIHSSTVSQKSSSGTMRTRSTASTSTSKAAPWLLPPNDAFLSQLSPFVGAHVGKSLPTLDLLHGAPTSPTLLSPIVTPSSPSAAAAVQTPTSGTKAMVASPLTTDAAGKNEKSLVQMDTERHGGNHAGKRDSTSMDISVLEVIEPTSHASPPLSSFEKNIFQKPDLICGMQYKKRSGDKSRGQAPHQSLSLRERRPRKTCYYSHSEENLVGYQEADDLYECISPYPRSSDKSLESKSVVPTTTQTCENDGEKVSRNLDSFNRNVDVWGERPLAEKRESVRRKESSVSYSPSSHASSKMQGGYVPQFPRPSSSFSILLSGRRRKGDNDNEQQEESRMLADASHETSCENEIRYKMNFSPPASAFDASGISHSAVAPHGESSYDTSSNTTGTRNAIPNSRTPSPKSYVTKLTVIPVEATTETCFLSIRSTSFGQEQDQQQQQQQQRSYAEPGQTDAAGAAIANVSVDIHQQQQHHEHDEEGFEDSHQLHLPGDNPDELSSIAFSCQIPSYSVSSSNTPVMPRFNSSGTVVFPQRKPSSDWHSTELLSLTTPDSSLAGRLSPTPSETSRTESALAPPPSYVSHASQNSEVSKTESARGGHHYHHAMNEVSAEERDLESPDGGDITLHLQSSFINHTTGNGTSAFQSTHPQLSLATAPGANSADGSSTTPAPENGGGGVDSSQSHKVGLGAEQMNSVMVMLDTLEMCKSDRKKNRDCSTCSVSPSNSKTKEHGNEEDRQAASPGAHDLVDDNDTVGDHHDGDNDRSTVKQQRGIFEKQHQNKRGPVSAATTSTARSIRSHLSTTSAQKARALQQQQRLPKGLHHHHRNHRGQSKPWYEIEGSDDEGSLLRVAKSRSSHSSNFSSSINPGLSSSNSPGSSTPVTNNPEESSSQNESAAEENQNNNSNAAGSTAPTQAEQKDEGEDGVEKVEQSNGSTTNGTASTTTSNGQGIQQQQNSSTSMTSNKKHNCSNFL